MVFRQDRADDAAIAKANEHLHDIKKRLAKIGSFWLERLIAGLVALLMLMATWMWTHEGRMSSLEDTIELERDAAIRAAIDDFREELTR